MAANQLDQLWTDIQGSLARLVPENVYRLWLEHLRPTALDDNILYLEGPDHMVEWVARRFGDTLSMAASAVDPLLQHVELLGGRSTSPNEPAAQHQAPVPPTGTPPRRLNPANSFNEFVIGDNNRFAHAAALAVAELPAHTYNPLLIYGDHGTGKTHLLQAIANYVSTTDPQLELRYLTAETFATAFRSSITTATIDQFKRQHRSPNIFLLDDVDFLADKQRTLDEFLYTTDELVESGSQVVLSSHQPPESLASLGARLQQRLQGGLAAEITTADPHTRFVILCRRAPQLRDQPEHLEVLHHLAAHVPGSIRALEGALIRVHAYASLTQQPLTIALAEHVLRTLAAPPPTSDSPTHPQPGVRDIQSHTSEALELDPTDLQSAKRNRQVVYARQVAMYLCRELTQLSLPAISRQFGGRDHTTVLHAHRKIKHRLLTDPDTRSLVANLSETLRGSPHTHLTP